MRSLAQVIKFSYITNIKNKSFIFSTVFVSLLIFALFFIPTIINIVDSNKTKENQVTDNVTASDSAKTSKESGKLVLISDDGGVWFNDTLGISKTDSEHVFEKTDKSRAELEQMIKNDEIGAFVVVGGQKEIEVIYGGSINVISQSGSKIRSEVDSYIQQAYKQQIFEKYNLSDAAVNDLYNPPVVKGQAMNIDEIASNSVQSFVFVFLLYMSIIMCGMLVATSVAQEKSLRAMELLISSTKPETLMFGKIIGVGLTGLTQILCILVAGILGYLINQDAIMSIEILSSMLSFKPGMIILCIVYYLGGYFMFSTLYGALGSLVSRIEDLNRSVSSITLVTVFAFLISIYGPIYGFSDMFIYKFFSYFPLTSPYVMLTRLGTGPVSVFSIAVSLAVLIGFTVLLGIVSAKVYRIGVLMYGKPPKLKDIINSLKQS